MGATCKVTIIVTTSILMLTASGYCFPEMMFWIATVYGILFVVMAVCFVGGMLNMGLREARRERRKQPCG